MTGPAVVPRPLRLQQLPDEPFVLLPGIAVVAPDAAARHAAQRLAALVGGSVQAAAAPDTPVLRLRLLGRDGDDLAGDDLADDDGQPAAERLPTGDELPVGDEAYRLRVRPDGVEVDARTPAGLGHAITTLAQLLTRTTAGAQVLPAVLVLDAPRFAWRGLSIDVARHFVRVGDLEVVVDLMADHKLNVLHLHLTDDQAWRIDLPSRPELVRRSSGASVGGDPGGHYTAEDYARLVAYAVARGIAVVPELDVPGHVNAALHAYGDLSPSGRPTDEYLGIEVGFSRLTAALPATGAFLHDVFGDIAAMTPGPYVHIGGDEVQGMAPDEYATLVGTAAAAVRAAGKQVVGWQEIATTPLEPGTVVQYWDVHADPAPFVAAGAAGARLLLSPGDRTYLDMKYHPGYPLGLEWAGHVELRDSYDWEPATLLPGLPAEALLGVEAAVWTETLRTLDDLTTMLLPRLAAVAEVAWSAADRRDWEDFRTRVAALGARWDAAGLSWYPSPQVDWQR
ncbi:beta-N-acetylhexosaminidase [Cellulomonas sp. SG140]|uniref:beta-N-acetylhexosaminidase n=1 Tax=Cellulomonas sp. SG140 TaxID=2976536 RepID=UPI0021E79BBB|nr:beta-N-acetylhexosaminidase [Cellulomonas sp. SG140]